MGAASSVVSSRVSSVPQTNAIATIITTAETRSMSNEPLTPIQMEPVQSEVVKYEILVSPRRQNNLIQCIPSTPKGAHVHEYPYYCPLCMEYFKDILRSKCCGNYMCFPCCLTYLQTRQIDVSRSLNAAKLLMMKLTYRLMML